MNWEVYAKKKEKKTGKKNSLVKCEGSEAKTKVTFGGILSKNTKAITFQG